MQLANRSIRAVCTTTLRASATMRIVSVSNTASNSGWSIRGTPRAKQVENEMPVLRRIAGTSSEILFTKLAG